MDRVFLDANVLVSAAWWNTSDLQGLWHLKNAELFSSDYAVAEATRNLDTEERRTRLADLLKGVAIARTPPVAQSLPDDITLPAKDRPILLSAIQNSATHLLTGDKRHFGGYFGKTVQGVTILRPGAYLKRIRGPSPRR